MAIHDRVSERYYGLVNSVESHESTRARVHWICRSVTGQTVLDVGCSQGITAILLAREGLRVTGIDLEEKSIQYARQELAKESVSVRAKAQFKLMDITDWKGKGSFDSIILGEILEHFARPETLLEHAHRLLVDNGTLVVTVPYGYHPFYDHKQTFYAGNLAVCLNPYFEIQKVELQHKYLCCVARKRSHLKRGVLPDAPSLMAWMQFDCRQFALLEQQHQQAMERRKKSLDQLSEQLKTLRKEKADASQGG